MIITDMEEVVKLMIESDPERYGSDDGTYFLLKDLGIANDMSDDHIYALASLCDSL